MNRRSVVASSCGVAVVTVVVFLSTRRAPDPPRPPIAAKPAVAPARPKVQILTGHIEAQQTIAVTMPAGTIEGFLADVGDRVAEGQALARLATGSTGNGALGDSALAPAQARITALKSASDEAKLEAARAKADAQRGKEEDLRARKAYEREQKLMDVGATPRKVFEQAGRASEAARLEAEKLDEMSRQADNRIYAVADQLREATAAAEAAAKQDADARASFAASEIHAPAAGMVVERNDAGPELFRIAVNLGKLRAVFGIAPGIESGQEVLITIPGLSVAPIHSVISAIDGTNATAEFENPNPAIVPGAQCSVSVQLK